MKPFRNINRYLLLQHPLLWNIRIIPVLFFAVCNHLLFFGLGWISIGELRSLIEYDYFNAREIEAYLTAVLLLIIGLCLWLMFYLRNNAFKSFYPLGPGQLRKEALLVVLIFTVNLPVFHSYLYGKHLKILKTTEKYDPQSDAEAVNLARCFLPVHASEFERQQCCDSQQAQQERISRAGQGEFCGESVVNTSEAPVPDTSAAPDYTPYTETYSYLFYCSYAVQLDRESFPGGDLHKKARRWLINGEKDSVRLALQTYLSTMDDYGLSYNVDVNELSERCFTDSLHSVPAFLETKQSDEYGTAAGSGQFDVLDRIIEITHRERQKNFLNISQWEFYGYAIYLLSTVLLLFRFTRLKPWLFALLGLGIWGIVLAIAGNILDNDLSYVLLALAVLSGILAIRLNRKGKNKTGSALWLHWFSIWMPGFLPLLADTIHRNTGELTHCVNNVRVTIREAYPIHHWIQSHWDLINAFNTGACLLMLLFVVVPLCYRWQALPNE